jgi:hypothetical protein
VPASNDPMNKPLPPLFFVAALILIGTVHAVLPGVPLLTGLWRLAGLPLPADGAPLAVAGPFTTCARGPDVRRH